VRQAGGDDRRGENVAGGDREPTRRPARRRSDARVREVLLLTRPRDPRAARIRRQGATRHVHAVPTRRSHVPGAIRRSSSRARNSPHAADRANRVARAPAQEIPAEAAPLSPGLRAGPPATPLAGVQRFPGTGSTAIQPDMRGSGRPRPAGPGDAINISGWLTYAWAKPELPVGQAARCPVVITASHEPPFGRAAAHRRHTHSISHNRRGYLSLRLSRSRRLGLPLPGCSL